MRILFLATKFTMKETQSTQRFTLSFFMQFSVPTVKNSVSSVVN
jgi:hypothetical protein